jgi:multisubunit Na+/H+ antiporter MnhC subunit
MTALIIGLGVVALIIIIAIAQRSGPRVTQITRTRRRDVDEDK